MSLAQRCAGFLRRLSGRRSIDPIQAAAIQQCANHIDAIERDNQRLRTVLGIWLLQHRSEISPPPRLEQQTEEVLHASRTIWKE